MPIPSHIDIPSEDIRLMSRPQLVELYGSKSSERIVLNRLFRGLILQAHHKIQRQEEAPIEGNLRTFWYRWVKPLMTRIPDDDELSSDPYMLMLKAFGQLVMDDQWIQYKDFDFTDENWAHRFIGSSRPNVLIFAEKRGWIRFLRRCHDELGTSALALGGAPSVLTSEYTIDVLQGQVEPGQTLHLFGLVDWDPAGHMIAHAFQNQLDALGPWKTQLELFIHPKHFTDHDIQLNCFELPQQRHTKTKRWVESTGGLDGEFFGLESEAMPWPKLRQLIEEKLSTL